MWYAFDYDDVIIDFASGVCEAVSRDFDCDVSVTDITDWNFGQFLDQYIGQDWWEWMERHAFLWGHKFKPIAGALGGLDRLRRDGHLLEILTAKPLWAESELWYWLGKYAPAVQKVTVVPVRKEGAMSKAEASGALVLVDDKPSNCVEWVNSKKARRAVLFDRPHNRLSDAETHSRITRAKNWSGVLNLLEAIDVAA